MELPSEPAARDVHGIRVCWPVADSCGLPPSAFPDRVLLFPKFEAGVDHCRKRGLERQAIWRPASELGRALGLKLVGVDHVTPQEDRSLQQKPPSPVNFGF
jgi:hypothetical protein